MIISVLHVLVIMGATLAGVSMAHHIRAMVRDSRERAAHVVWLARYDYRAQKYSRSYWSAPVTLRKPSDNVARPSWLYDGANRRMLRAIEIKGL